MKKIFMVFLLMVCASFIQANPIKTSVRIKEKFNTNWKFYLGDNPIFRSVGFDDKDWRILNLPHDFTIEGEYNENNPSGGNNGYFPIGIGWYRKSFTVADSVKDRKTVIQFDGVYMNSEVWINEHFLGRYPYGYTTFQYDLTEYLNYGENATNVIAVRVDNSLPKSTRWYNGSGIYRNVHLITTNYAHFKNYDGIFITTPVAEENKAIVAIEYKVMGNVFSKEQLETFRNNKWDRKRDENLCIARSIIYDANGDEVARTEEEMTFLSFSRNIEYNQKVQVTNPIRWSTENPYLYTLKSEIEFEGKIVDDQVTTFGIRKLEYIPHKGMFVNGKSVNLKGVCLHHDGGCVGAAVPDKIWHYRLSKLKAMGCNALRTAHNPFAPEFYDMADSMGFYVMDEALDEWTRGWPYNFTENNRGKAENGYQLYFDQWGETDLRKMIQRDRNHPCVVMYSIGNEIPDQLTEEGVAIAKHLVAVCHEQDSSRPVTSGCDQYMTGRLNGFMDALDISGFNYVERHLADSMYLAEYVRRPEKLSVGTETGKSEKYFTSYRDNNYAIGQFIWVGWDYLGEAKKAPQRGWQGGLFDVSGNIRPDGMRYEAYWSNSPVVNICMAKDDEPKKNISSWNWEKNDKLIVSTYSNCEEVELLLNGRSLGRKKNAPDSYTCQWNLKYKSGTLTAKAYNKGEMATEQQLFSTEKASMLKINPVWSEMKADGQDINILEIEVVDDYAHIVPEAQDMVTVEVEGNAKLIGIDSGNMYYEGSFKDKKRNATRGRLIAIIQAETQAGTAKVKVSANGLAPAIIKIPIQQ